MPRALLRGAGWWLFLDRANLSHCFLMPCPCSELMSIELAVLIGLAVVEHSLAARVDGWSAFQILINAVSHQDGEEDKADKCFHGVSPVVSGFSVPTYIYASSVPSIEMSLYINELGQAGNHRVPI